MANKEALFIVVGIDEPACDSIRTIASNLTGARVKNIHTFHFNLNLSLGNFQKLDIWLAKDNKEIAFTGVLKIFCHMKIGSELQVTHHASLVTHHASRRRATIPEA